MNNSLEGSTKDFSKSFRWIVLILISVVIGTNYYVYDALSSIKSVLQAQLDISSTDYGLIVSFYSFPNTFLLMAVIGGIILDKWGIKKTGLMFVSFCVAGAGITAYGASDAFAAGGLGYDLFSSFLPEYSPELKMMFLGRLLFGLGAETSIIVINKVIVKWFKGKELALAFAINVAIARFGTAAALILSPELVGGPNNVGNAIWLATILMGIGLVFFFIYSVVDSKKVEIAKSSEDDFKFSDVFSLIFNWPFVYIVLLCVTFYSAVFPFQAYCPDMLHNKFGVSLEWSGRLTSLIIWGTILFTPIFGWFVDKRGKRATMMIYGSLLLLVAHLSLALTDLTPFVSMFILGVAFSLVPAAMWPSVALIVEEKKLGTAYGVMTSVQNVGLWGFPILAGLILDATNPGVTPKMIEEGVANYDYTYTMIMFAGLGLLGLFFAFMLKTVDKGKGGYGLDQP